MHRLIRASAHAMPMLADRSVHSIITSPPFYGLRSYAGAQDVEWPTVAYAPMPGLPALAIPGCDPTCEHEWIGGPKSSQRQRNGSEGGLHDGRATNKLADNITLNVQQGRYCQKCGGWRGPLGLEPTPEMYTAHLILCLREWHRVLRDDGLVFINLGDSYAGSWGNHGARAGGQRSRIAERWHRPSYEDKRTGWTATPPTASVVGVREKSLLGIPWRLAFAAEADGWILRRDLIWAKGVSFAGTYAGNSMPESVQDRPSSSHEYIFMLSKQPRYYFDKEALREGSPGGQGEDVVIPNQQAAQQRVSKTWHTTGGASALRHDRVPVTRKVATERPDLDDEERSGRGVRSVWAINPRPYRGAEPKYKRVDPETDVLAEAYYQPTATCPAHTDLVRAIVQGGQVGAVEVGSLGLCLPAKDVLPLPEGCTCAVYQEEHSDHFAVWPEALAEKMILCATSAAGACPKCGAPWVRISDQRPTAGRTSGNKERHIAKEGENGRLNTHAGSSVPWAPTVGATIGWRASCHCEAGELVSCVILDPFSGSGTTIKVALEHNRDAIGVDLSVTYVEGLGVERLANLQPYLLGIGQ